jgi:release factor glutamine methyltransferase
MEKATQYSSLLATYFQTLQHLYDTSEIEAIFNLAVEYIDDNASTITNGALFLTQTLTKLQTGKPIQQILGRAYFWDAFYKVDENTLIPRPETEELIDWIKKTYQHQRNEAINILDIGTGSGCIAITLKKLFPYAEVIGLDISIEALTIAKENASIEGQYITFIQDSILNYKHTLLNNKWDIIVSNPPYITVEEKDDMHENVLAHEPHTALFVTNGDVQQFYKAILNYSQQHLKDNGSVFLELNAQFGKETAQLYESYFRNVILKQDMQYKDRMLHATAFIR